LFPGRAPLARYFFALASASGGGAAGGKSELNDAATIFH
jgi:hypothetical protein